MKNIKILSALLIIQSTNSFSSCEEYVSNDWPDSRYTIQTISNDNVVTDIKTGLMWKQCIEGLSGSSCTTNSPSLHTWSEALDLPVNLNNNSGFAGYNDWRLPNINELLSIVAFNCNDPTINHSIFPNPNSGQHWSSSPVAYDNNRAWFIYFLDGSTYHGDHDDVGRVRLVRSVQ